MSSKLPAPKQFQWTSTTNITTFMNPKNLAFYYGHWAVNHPKMSHAPKTMLHYSSGWVPAPYLILFSVMMNGVFDEASLDAFINMIKNNGAKAIDNYAKNDLSHDAEEKDTYYFEVSFRNLNKLF